MRLEENLQVSKLCPVISQYLTFTSNLILVDDNNVTFHQKGAQKSASWMDGHNYMYFRDLVIIQLFETV